MSEVKEWVKVSQSSTGNTVVTVSLVEGNLSSKWAVKTFITSVKSAVVDARRLAYRGLADLRDVMEAIEQEES